MSWQEWEQKYRSRKIISLTNNNMSSFLKLNLNDFTKGAVVAVLVAVLGAIQQALGAHGLDVASWDWGSIINLALTAFLGYMGKNLMTDENGKVLGMGK